MKCASCASGNQVEYPTELNIHFHGHENLNKSGVSAKWLSLLIKADNCTSSGKCHSTRRIPTRLT